MRTEFWLALAKSVADIQSALSCTSASISSPVELRREIALAEGTATGALCKSGCGRAATHTTNTGARTCDEHFHAHYVSMS